METLTATPSKTTIFKNLFKALKLKAQKEHEAFMDTLNAESDVKSILDKWQYANMLPKGRKGAIWSVSDIKAYLIKRSLKATEKAIAKDLLKLQTVESAGTFKEITVSIEWKKSQMWGNNPKASAKINTGSSYEYTETGSIGGCGYDKESTAVAQAVNQVNAFLKALYLVKEENIETDNRELFGYGAGYGILPYLEGGVGVSCYSRICEKIGYTFKNTASGKAFDVYTISKIS